MFVIVSDSDVKIIVIYFILFYFILFILIAGTRENPHTQMLTTVKYSAKTTPDPWESPPARVQYGC